MNADQEWLTLVRFMAQEIVELAFKQHLEISVDHSQSLYGVIHDHLSKYNMTEVLLTEIKVKLGLG